MTDRLRVKNFHFAQTGGAERLNKEAVKIFIRRRQKLTVELEMYETLTVCLPNSSIYLH